MVPPPQAGESSLFCFSAMKKPPVQAGRRSFIALFLPDMARKFS
ncbi:hypothetical protein HMPREF0239_00563 [Clostridium sp. ATCC BAA-442]|nr:hypothetical protein HMPREF0239_00563 [Clostridium sp. ATCC BAA-442]